MTLRSLTAAALVAVGLGTAAAPALAQGSRTVTVMGMTFEQPAGNAHPAHEYGRVQAR